MDCEAAQELYVGALVAGQASPGEVERHLTGCEACRQAGHGLAAAWSALAGLPAVDPSPSLTRRLRRRIQLEAAREALASVESWQRAALAGVAAFVVSVMLSFLLPYQTMVALCEAIAPPGLPTPAAYLAAGLLYGLLPMLVGTALGRHATPGFGLLGTFEASLVFLVVLVPYVLLRCGEFPVPLLAGLIGGIALGAGLGGAVGTGLGRRHSWGF